MHCEGLIIAYNQMYIIKTEKRFPNYEFKFVGLLEECSVV